MNWASIDAQWLNNNNIDIASLWGPTAGNTTLQPGMGNFKVFGRPVKFGASTVIRAVNLGVGQPFCWSDLTITADKDVVDTYNPPMHLVPTDDPKYSDGVSWQNGEFYPGILPGLYQLDLAMFGRTEGVTPPVPPYYNYNWGGYGVSFNLYILKKDWTQGDAAKQFSLTGRTVGMPYITYENPYGENPAKLKFFMPCTNIDISTIVGLEAEERLGFTLYSPKDTNIYIPPQNPSITMRGTCSLVRLCARNR